MERTNAAARQGAALTPAQRRALLALYDDGNARVRSDVIEGLQGLGLVGASTSRYGGGPYRLTDGGRLVADELRVQLLGMQREPARPVDVVEVLLQVEHGTAPASVPGAVARMLLALPTDAERVAALRWLAGPDGARYLGRVGDAFIVGSRPGRSYQEVADHLGVSVRAVNKAVVRQNARRQYNVDKATPTGG